MILLDYLRAIYAVIQELSIFGCVAEDKWDECSRTDDAIRNAVLGDAFRYSEAQQDSMFTEALHRAIEQQIGKGYQRIYEPPHEKNQQNGMCI